MRRSIHKIHKDPGGIVLSEGEVQSQEIGPLVPMAIAFVGIGISLLAALPFVEDEIGVIVNAGAAVFLMLIGVICAIAAKKKGEFKTLKRVMGRKTE